MDLNVIRTAHSVGQGAYYSEHLGSPYCDKRRIVVYDCGSESIPKSKTKSQSRISGVIKGSLPDKEDIDVLFISHFHFDHVSGIKELVADGRKINYVVIPQIDNYEWFYIINDALSYPTKNPDADLIQNVKGVLKNSYIIQVEPLSRDNINPANEPIEINDDIHKNIPSGSCLKFPESRKHSNSPLWVYIPINTMDKDKVKNLKDQLQPIFNKELNSSKDLKAIKPTDIVNVINKKRKDINTIYTKIFGGGNESSMCLYSGAYSMDTNSDIRILRHGCHVWFYEKYMRDYYYHYCHGYRNEACLYTGDANLKDSTLMNCIGGLIGEKSDRIGTLQLPHHGSINNLDEDALNHFNRLLRCFVSYGTTNNYGHPSSYLCNMISSRNLLFEVTEKMDTTYSEYIRVCANCPKPVSSEDS